MVAPMFFLGNASGHDFQFHIASWMDAAGQWREGVGYPRWAEWANWGFGEPRFIFYPPGSWMLGAALGTVLPWRLVPGTFIWLALVAAGMAMGTLGREWLGAPQGIVAAVLFAVNPYHLVIVYYRSDFAELLAGAFLPLVIWAAVHVARGDWRSVPLLAAAFSAIWLCDAPAAVVATYALAVVLVTTCVVKRTLAPLLWGGAAMTAGFGVAAVYILPAAWERRWVQIAQAVADNLQTARNFLFTHANDPDFVRFNWKVSSVAVGVALVAAVAAIFVSSKRRGFPEPFPMLAVLGVVSVLLMFPFTNSLWRTLPELRFVQFPWRWLEVLAVAWAFFLSAALCRLKRGWPAWLAGVAVFAAIAAAGTAMVRSAWWDDSDVAATVGAIGSGRGYRGTDEYDPVGCDRYELPGDPDDTERAEGVSAVPAERVEKLDPDSGNVIPASDIRIDIDSWSAEHHEFTAETAAPVTLAVRLLNYPAWELRIDGQGTAPGVDSDDGQMLVALEPGKHQVSIDFRREWDRNLGGAVSIVCAFSLLTLLWRGRRGRPRA